MPIRLIPICHITILFGNRFLVFYIIGLTIEFGKRVVIWSRLVVREMLILLVVVE